MMRHDRSHTKIIATLGPASSDKDVLRKLFFEGIDVCRLNFSHGTHDRHLKNIELVRELNEELDARVAILADHRLDRTSWTQVFPRGCTP